jgi:hypothetical protein
MNAQPMQIEKYGGMVWQHPQMDELRRTECLCLNCDILSVCQRAAGLYNLCREHNLALAVTRCPLWQPKA